MWHKTPILALISCLSLLFFTACTQQDGSSGDSDSSSIAMDTTLPFAHTTAFTTLLGETIHLQPNEHYCLGEYLSYNASSNLLLFETSTGEALEVISPPWSRTGTLQIFGQQELRPKINSKYEIIYRIAPSSQAPTDTQLILIDIIPAGTIFHEYSRYQADSESHFTAPVDAKGVFINDVNDDELECKKTNGLPELYYKFAKASSFNRLNLTVVNSRIIKAEIENGISFFLRFHENNWEQIDLLGSRRTYRKLVR